MQHGVHLIIDERRPGGNAEVGSGIGCLADEEMGHGSTDNMLTPMGASPRARIVKPGLAVMALRFAGNGRGLHSCLGLEAADSYPH
jgi:hypothetical protein